MKKYLCILAVLGLALSTAAAYAGVIFSDDFSVPPNSVGSQDPNWLPKNQPGWLVPDWQVTVDQKYSSVNSDYSGVNYGWAVVNGLTVSDYVMEADINITAAANGGNAGFIIRGTDIYGEATPYGGCNFTMLQVQGPAYGGRIVFSHFEFLRSAPYANIYDGAGWSALPQSGLEGAYVHLKLTAQGTLLIAEASSYDPSGVLVATAAPLVLDQSTTPAYDGSPWPTSGWAGIFQYSSVVKFDNVVISDVPEPGSMMALVTGLGFAAAAFRKRRA